MTCESIAMYWSSWGDSCGPCARWWSPPALSHLTTRGPYSTSLYWKVCAEIRVRGHKIDVDLWPRRDGCLTIGVAPIGPNWVWTDLPHDLPHLGLHPSPSLLLTIVSKNWGRAHLWCPKWRNCPRTAPNSVSKFSHRVETELNLTWKKLKKTERLYRPNDV